jgi:hypothetical protein
MSRTSRIVGALALFAAFTAGGCDEPHAGPDLAGAWAAAATASCGPSLTLTLSESRNGDLSGTGRATFPGICGMGSVNYTVAGHHDHPSVSAQLTSTLNADLLGWERVSLGGTLSGADTIKTQLTLSGGTQPVNATLVRQ